MFRYDTANIDKLTLDPTTGFLIAKDVPICRTGVFPYRGADGAIKYEAKLPEEILSNKTIESANGKPITDDHPTNGTLVDSQNIHDLGKGFTATNAHKDGDKIKVDLFVTDQALIDKIQAGKQELSIGFSTKLDNQAGEYNGIRYDMAQRDIQINHVAVVQRGRAGHGISIVGDSAEQIPELERKEEAMEYTKVRLGDSDITVAKDDAEKVTNANSKLAEINKHADELETLKAEKKDLETKIDALEADVAKAKKETDTAQAKADSADEKNKELETKLDSIDDLVEERINLCNQAKKFLGDSYDFKGKTAKAIKEDAIKAVRGDDFDLEGKSEDYINAYFDGIKDSAKDTVVGFNGTTKQDSEDEITSILHSRYNLYNKEGGNK